MIATDKAIEQLDLLLKEYGELRSKAKYDDLSDLDAGRVLANRLLAAIERFARPGSSYTRQLNDYARNPSGYMSDLMGLAAALRDDLKAGWMQSVVELVHADTFSDFLETAEGLLGGGYKNAAAVVAGTSLEVHLRSLCGKHGIPSSVSDKPKKADTMNADLKKAGAYGGLEQKNITAWLDLRNSAAHGEYEKYDAKDVGHLIRGIRDFMVKYPA
jgi:hypothetical protein